MFDWISISAAFATEASAVAPRCAFQRLTSAFSMSDAALDQ